MATTIKTTHRSLVALSLPKSVPALIVQAQGRGRRRLEPAGLAYDSVTAGPIE